jgi:uncharacterized protein DUF3825
MDGQQRNDYGSRFRDAIRDDSQAYRSMKNRFKDAVELALKRVRWNFKTSIPQYFPARDEMSLLLPLDIVSDEQPDLALVVERTRSGNYLGHTVLPLDWAYNNARLVCQPLSDWLMPERIQESPSQGSESSAEIDTDSESVGLPDEVSPSETR